MTGNSSPIALGLPGKLTISVRPAIPDTPRDRIPIGVCLSASARIASANPGASRSITALVASGVTSSWVKPVPPVVKISATPSLRVAPQHASRSPCGRRVRTSRATISAPAPSASLASASPERSLDAPAATEVEMVMIAVFMACNRRVRTHH